MLFIVEKDVSLLNDLCEAAGADCVVLLPAVAVIRRSCFMRAS